MKSSTQKTVKYYFKKPDEISSQILDQIQLLIKKGGEVGSACVKENLENAFLIGYALDQEGLVIGTVTLKHPKEAYRRKIEAATGLDLSGYLERGYTSVEPEFRNYDVGDRLIKGLIERSEGQNIYVTIRMDNTFALALTYKNNMVLAAQFINERTGHKIGLFTNQ
jgi:GNAT superfamily N-acetyltransferase